MLYFLFWILDGNKYIFFSFSIFYDKWHFWTKSSFGGVALFVFMFNIRFISVFISNSFCFKHTTNCIFHLENLQLFNFCNKKIGAFCMIFINIKRVLGLKNHLGSDYYGCFVGRLRIRELQSALSWVTSMLYLI